MDFIKCHYLPLEFLIPIGSGCTLMYAAVCIFKKHLENKGDKQFNYAFLTQEIISFAFFNYKQKLA